MLDWSRPSSTATYGNSVTYFDTALNEHFYRTRAFEREDAERKWRYERDYWAVGESRALALADMPIPPLTLSVCRRMPPRRARRLGPRRTARHMTWKTMQRHAPTKGVHCR